MTKAKSKRAHVDPNGFNPDAKMFHNLRRSDFEIAMQDVYDFFADTNDFLTDKDLSRLDEMLRAANMSGMLSDMLTDSLATHSRSLVRNNYHNGHPDLLVRNRYANNSEKAGEHGIEIKTTRKRGGVVDTHGARNQIMCVFCYAVDNITEPAIERDPMWFTEIYLSDVTEADFRRNDRGERGTRTSALHKEGASKLRSNWIYRTPIAPVELAMKARDAAAAKQKKSDKKLTLSP